MVFNCSFDTIHNFWLILHRTFLNHLNIHLRKWRGESRSQWTWCNYWPSCQRPESLNLPAHYSGQTYSSNSSWAFDRTRGDTKKTASSSCCRLPLFSVLQNETTSTPTSGSFCSLYRRLYLSCKIRYWTRSACAYSSEMVPHLLIVQTTPCFPLQHLQSLRRGTRPSLHCYTCTVLCLVLLSAFIALV